MAFKRDQSGWKAFRLWLGALVLACAIGWAGSFLPSMPARAQQQGLVTCDQSANASAAAATATAVAAAATGSAKIHVCGYDLAAGAGTAQFSYGATCTALGTPVSPQWAANAQVSTGAPHDIVIPSGNALCLTSGTGGSATAEIYYTLQ